MKWFGLKIDGEVRYVMQREEKPSDQEFHLVFGIAINSYMTEYEVIEVFVYKEQMTSSRFTAAV